MAWSLEEARRHLEALPAPTVIIDDARRLVVANTAGREVLGVEEGAEVALPTRASADEPRIDQRHVLGAGGEPFLASVAWRGIEFDQVAHTLVQVLPIRGPAREQVLEARDLEVLRHGTAIAQLGIFEHDHLTGAIWISPEMRRIYGWGPEKPATLASLMASAHPDDGPRVGAAIARAHDPTGDGWCDVEGRLFWPNGEIRWIRTRSRTYFEGEGAARRPSRTIGAIVDLTDARHLAETRARLTSVLDETPDLVAIVDGAGRIEYANPAVRSFFGHPDSLDQVPAASLLGDSAALGALVDRAVPEALEKGRASAELTLPNGRSLSVVLLVHRHRTGGVSHYSAIARDTTAIRTIEEQLRQSQKMEAIGRLAGGIAHDFNNLLSVVLSYSALMLEDLGPSARGREDLEQIQLAGQRAAELTRQLLAFSRQQRLAPRELSLNEIVGGMEKMIRRLIGEDVELVVLLAPELDPVLVDGGQLEQVLMNLVINARDAMPNGGRLTIETSRADFSKGLGRLRPGSPLGPYSMLSVSDTGHGMDEDTKARVFEPFFTTKDVGKGTGLGLSMVHGIVEQSGGTIMVESQPGRGSTFRIYLPRSPGEPKEITGDLVVPASVEGETLLLVEDEDQVRILARKILRRLGYRVLEARGADEALRTAAGAPRIDLLLTDVVMPKTSGRELAALLKDRFPHLKVLFMSGYTDDAVMRQGALPEGTAFLQKPLTPDGLAKKLREVLDGSAT